MSDDLIRRQDAIDAVKGRFSIPVDNLIVEVIGALPSAQSTIEAVEVVHGEWQDEQCGRWIYAKCNLCGKVQDVRSNYCPNCGANMDGNRREANGI